MLQLAQTSIEDGLDSSTRCHCEVTEMSDGSRVLEFMFGESRLAYWDLVRINEQASAQA